MKKVFAIVGVISAMALGGCTGAQLTAMQATQLVSQAQVPIQDVIAMANAWDLLVAGAAQYRVYCKANKYPQPACSASNRIAVIRARNSGRAARNTLETYIAQGQPVGPGAVYQTLISAYTALKATPAPQYATGAVAASPTQ